MDLSEGSPNSLVDEEEDNGARDSRANSYKWSGHSGDQEEVGKYAEENENRPGKRDKNRRDKDKSLDLNQLEKDKQQVYRHPLFPLLALLLEKCEQATATLGTNEALNISEESFNEDIKAFISHQQKENKNLLGDNPEVDALMITAIQVLRIHLLELEKVQELCKDFCQRYICCLRGKMNSENLLRDANGLQNNSSLDNTSCSSSDADENSSNFSSHTLSEENVLEINDSLPSTIRKDFAGSLSAQTHKNTPRSSKSPKVSSKSSNFKVDSGTEGDLSDDASNVVQKRNQKRGILPKHATSILRSWLFQHIVHPYPTEEEKKAIATETNLTLLQVNNWFINARRRILQPMLDSANVSGEGKGDSQEAEIGKEAALSPLRRLKLNTKNGTFQRFWPESVSNAIRVRDSQLSDKDSRSK